MLSAEDIVKHLQHDRAKGFIERLAATLREQQFDLNKLIDLTFYPDAQIAFRAAWLLDTMILARPELYVNNLEYFVLRMRDVTNASCKRHYARIIMHLTAPNAPEPIILKLKSIDLENVVEQCFDWMIDPKIKVAVQVFVAETLFNLRHRYDWITEELTNQLKFLMRNGGPAVQSRGKKLLKCLQ